MSVYTEMMQLFGVGEARKTRSGVELGKVTSTDPLKIKVGESEYDAEHFEIYCPMPRKIVQDKPITYDGGEGTHDLTLNEYDLKHEIDRDKALELKVDDYVSVQDNGQTLIILGVMKNMKGVPIE